MVKLIKSLLKAMFCRHTEYQFIRNIGGDEMTVHIVSGKGHRLAKSEWQCVHCKLHKYESYRIEE